MKLSQFKFTVPKNLIAKYQKAFEENKLNEKKFQEAFKVFKELNPELEEKDIRALIMGKAEDKESKETDISSLQKSIMERAKK